MTVRDGDTDGDTPPPRAATTNEKRHLGGTLRQMCTSEHTETGPETSTGTISGKTSHFVGTISRCTRSSSLASLCIAMPSTERTYLMKGITGCQEYSKHASSRMALQRGNQEEAPSPSNLYSRSRKSSRVRSQSRPLAKFRSYTRVMASVTPFFEPSGNSEGGGGGGEGHLQKGYSRKRCF